MKPFEPRFAFWEDLIWYQSTNPSQSQMVPGWWWGMVRNIESAVWPKAPGEGHHFGGQLGLSLSQINRKSCKNIFDRKTREDIYNWAKKNVWPDVTSLFFRVKLTSDLTKTHQIATSYLLWHSFGWPWKSGTHWAGVQQEMGGVIYIPIPYRFQDMMKEIPLPVILCISVCWKQACHVLLHTMFDFEGSGWSDRTQSLRKYL